MAALLSSPLGPQYRHDPFEQPSSPKCYSLHDDLPADFDKSFGSSMSISDSLDGHSSQPLAASAAAAAAAAAVAAAMPPPPFLFGNSLGLPTAFHAKSHQPQFLAQLHHQPTSHISPRPANSLGAAMGTSLNARSPNLAAKMSSPKDMDISPAPVAPLPHLGPSPSEALPHLLDNIHVGRPSTAAAANLHHDRLHPVLGGSTRPRPLAAERKSSLQLAHSMSSRLFGAEIALNSNRIFARDQQLLNSSPDKEPPPKRRPNSLPTRQSEANERISQLSAALTAIPPPRTRPALSATFDGAFGVASSSQPTSSFALRSGSPDAVASLNKRNSKRSSRASSTESFFEDVENELGAQSTAAEQADTNDNHWQHRALLDHDHDDAADEDDANPSPSPSMNSIAGTMAGYFFDPMSPEKLGSRLGMPPVDGPNLLAAMSSAANSPSVSSPPASSPCTRMPPPKRTTSLGTRAFARANTVAAVPRAASASSSASASTSTAAAGAASRTMLGKRANPYVKRPSLTNATATVKSAYPVLGVAGQTNRVVRPTAPAPRRCFSAFDHRPALAAGAPPSKLATPAIDSPASPDRRRTPLSSHAEMSDANGSPIAPAMRARTRPNLLRRGSKDDSSPLAYGTGIKRSGSRGNDMVGDLALADPAYVGSPASAESLPGFGASEKEGKVLPCFNVKEDGLMRITPQTMTDLLAGKYTNAIQSFQVVDCRFGYEYEGGHIPGAINLSTVDRVVGHFLTPGQGRHAGGVQLPPRSQSGRADRYGNRRKHVIVFHCEFSCKRAPSMALALRQADRGLAHDYPNCHFPEIYILQGGYCRFFREYAQLCEPQQYICMDDPRFLARRSSELNGFRKQFSRHRSFTYGEGRRQVSQSCQGRQTIKEEDAASLMDESPCPGMPKILPSKASLSSVVGKETNEQAAGDTSFGSVGDSSFEDGIGDSPCAAAGSRKPVTMLLQPRVGSLGRRPLLRAGTTGNILPRF